MTVKVDDPKNPVNAVFRGQGFEIADQAFQFQEPKLRDHLHVLLSIDAEKTCFHRGGGFCRYVRRIRFSGFLAPVLRKGTGVL
jgi:hypothetical protein